MTARDANVESTQSADGDFGEEFWCRNNFAKASCPFCGTKGLEVDYSSYGTDLYCADGCHGRYVFPCAPFEAWEMWQRDNTNSDYPDLMS